MDDVLGTSVFEAAGLMVVPVVVGFVSGRLLGGWGLLVWPLLATSSLAIGSASNVGRHGLLDVVGFVVYLAAATTLVAELGVWIGLRVKRRSEWE